MSTPRNAADVEFIYNKMIVISSGLGSSPLIYAFVIYLLSRSMPAATAPVPGHVPGYVLVSAGILCLCAALIVRSMLMEPNRLARRIASGPVRPGQPAAYAPIMTAQVIAMAAAEVAGIFGILLFVLSRDLLGAYLLTAVSFSGMLMLAPRRNALAELLESVAAQNAVRRG